MGGEIGAGNLAAVTIIHFAPSAAAPRAGGCERRAPFTTQERWTTCPRCLAALAGTAPPPPAVRPPG